MENRINAYQKAPNAMKNLYALGMYVNNASLEKPLLHLLYFRVSQINGCGYCLDMHSKDFRAAGGTEQKLYLLDAWREAPIYSEREKAALAWAEAVTKLQNSNVGDEVYDEASSQFSEEELIDLTLAVIAINGFNRINISFRMPVGSYQPAAQTV